jgi:hypothetical protein
LSARKAKFGAQPPLRDEGDAYLAMLVAKAAALNVPLIQAQALFSGDASPLVYGCLPGCDLVTYPSLSKFWATIARGNFFHKQRSHLAILFMKKTSALWVLISSKWMGGHMRCRGWVASMLKDSALSWIDCAQFCLGRIFFIRGNQTET